MIQKSKINSSSEESEVMMMKSMMGKDTSPKDGLWAARHGAGDDGETVHLPLADHPYAKECLVVHNVEPFAQEFLGVAICRELAAVRLNRPFRQGAPAVHMHRPVLA